MRKVFLDCGVREGDGIAAFLGNREVGDGRYYECLRPRDDAFEFELIGFESPRYAGNPRTRERFSGLPFTLIENLAWIHGGWVLFDSDGLSPDCRILEVSRTESAAPWRHPNPSAELFHEPCLDLAAFVGRHFSSEDYLVLKLDIEGAEYEVLDHLMGQGMLSWFRELYVEYHWWGRVSLRPRIEEHLRALPHLHYRDDWP